MKIRINNMWEIRSGIFIHVLSFGKIDSEFYLMFFNFGIILDTKG